MHTASRTTRRRALVALGAAGLTGLLLAACGSSTNAASSTTATSSSGAGSGATTTSAGGSSGSSSSSQLHALSSSIQTAEHATFKAVYTSQSSSGTETITIEQKPPKSVFGSGTTSVINDGTHTYVCTPTGGSTQCMSESGSTNPLSSLATLFSPQALLSVFQQAEAQAAAHAQGYTLTFSDGTYAGQHAKCVSATGGAQGSGKYCVTDSGILAYVQSSSNTFQLSSYSSSPPDSDFALPSGATVITVPAIP
ncbi:MAG TPA: hypothetical protein VMV22_10655 [Acidimicrobiales bacterium]|nr:hypothetical protein [Acidimicrobiales bacterium]